MHPAHPFHPGPRQAPRVDAGDRHRAFAPQVGRQRFAHAEVGFAHRQVLDDQAGGVHFRGLDVFVIDADVADVRIGQRDDLAAVARVGEDFLVAGEGGVEHHLASGLAHGTNGDAFKHRTVSEREKGFRVDGQHEDLQKWGGRPSRAGGGCRAGLPCTPP